MINHPNIPLQPLNHKPKIAIAIIILAGGEGKRFGGVNKALLPFGKHNLAQHMLAKSRSLFAHVQPFFTIENQSVALNSNQNIADFSSLNIDIIKDHFSDYRGPLSGVFAGLQWAINHSHKVDYIFTLPCDTPLLPDDLLLQMLLHLHHISTSPSPQLPYRKSIFLRHKDRNHPVIGLWHVDNRDKLADFLEGEYYKVQRFIDECEHDWCDYDGFQKDYDPFLNVNHKEDLMRAEQLFLNHNQSLI